jgi:hypothetical protein
MTRQHPLEPTSSPRLSTVRLRIAPAWLAGIGALLLLAGSILPWMRLFEAPFTPASVQEAVAGGIWQEPGWVILSLVTLAVAVINNPYRWWILGGIAAAFGVKMWLVYNALSSWLYLNELEQGRTGPDLAPFATTGEGWYLTLVGGLVLLIALLYHGWRERLPAS